MRRLSLFQAAFCLLFWSAWASAQTNWPSYISGLEPGLSQSPIVALVPSDSVVTPPDSTVPADKARWSGKWYGWACQSQSCDFKLVVEKVTEQGATIFYASASKERGRNGERLQARFRGDELQAALGGGQLAVRMRKSGELEFVMDFGQGRQVGGVLSQNDYTQGRLVDRIPTKFVENAKPVTLEVVIFKPAGPGPFPTVMFNHGSTGRGNNPALFNSTWTSTGFAKFFTDKGWLVAFPQRRGRGKSDGLYDEGFETNRSQYSCNPELSLPGVDHALADMDAAVEYLLARPDVDAKRMVIGGQSRGGILAVAYAGTRPQQFIGIINFVGGWLGEGCASAESINSSSFKRGSAYRNSSLWLYGENDRFYKMDHSRKNFEAFTAAGGIGAFKAFAVPAGQDGHNLIGMSDLWRESVEAYVSQLERK